MWYNHYLQHLGHARLEETYLLKAQFNYHVSISAAARRSHALKGPIAFVALRLLCSSRLSRSLHLSRPRCRRFWGVIVVVVICICAPHVVKETSGVVIVRMGEDDRPSPTTTRHVLPLW